jgi:hypothetical protein
MSNLRMQSVSGEYTHIYVCLCLPTNTAVLSHDAFPMHERRGSAALQNTLQYSSTCKRQNGKDVVAVPRSQWLLSRC